MRLATEIGRVCSNSMISRNISWLPDFTQALASSAAVVGALGSMTMVGGAVRNAQVATIEDGRLGKANQRPAARQEMLQAWQAVKKRPSVAAVSQLAGAAGLFARRSLMTQRRELMAILNAGEVGLRAFAQLSPELYGSTVERYKRTQMLQTTAALTDDQYEALPLHTLYRGLFCKDSLIPSLGGGSVVERLNYQAALERFSAQRDSALQATIKHGNVPELNGLRWSGGGPLGKAAKWRPAFTHAGNAPALEHEYKRYILTAHSQGLLSASVECEVALFFAARVPIADGMNFDEINKLCDGLFTVYGTFEPSNTYNSARFSVDPTEELGEVLMLREKPEHLVLAARAGKILHSDGSEEMYLSKRGFYFSEALLAEGAKPMAFNQRLIDVLYGSLCRDYTASDAQKSLVQALQSKDPRAQALRYIEQNHPVIHQQLYKLKFYTMLQARTPCEGFCRFLDQMIAAHKEQQRLGVKGLPSLQDRLQTEMCTYEAFKFHAERFRYKNGLQMVEVSDDERQVIRQYFASKGISADLTATVLGEEDVCAGYISAPACR